MASFLPTGKPLVYLITVTCSAGFLNFGYDQGVFAGSLVSHYYLTTFGPNPETPPDASTQGTTSALFDIGGAVGALAVMFIGAILGRRRTIQVGCVLVVVGAILQATSSTLGQLIAGRLVTGLGVGIQTTTVPNYLAECTPAASRGAHMAIEICFCALGLFLAQWINYSQADSESHFAFSFPLAFQVVFVVFTGFFCFVLPESPRWLVSKGRIEEAEQVVMRLLGEGATSETPEVRQMMTEMIEAEELETRGGAKNRFKQLFTSGPTQNARRVGLACLVAIGQQATGVNAVTYYVPTLLQKYLKVGRHGSLLIGGFFSVVSFVFTLPTIVLIDKIGRIALFIIGCAIQAICWIIIAALIPTAPEGSSVFGGVIVAFIFVFFASYSTCWLATSWAYGAEVLPLNIRSDGLGFAGVWVWFFNFVIVEWTPSAIEDIGYKYYIILAVFNVAMIPIFYFFAPETRGKTLEQMDFYFASKYGGQAALEAVEAEHRVQDKNGSVRTEELEKVSDPA
ncbi:general substrate transporter [Gloeophyllum trabeum ATCC 11539]|uniref:General substrate transporter n=1 Tax=Gloeophyllum trabeum (strain ATCC 11539 / FP-39264 / Madison 617) TaxID=670483 RepID=S7QK60_GLOTA|nr:general substrate transporter [Gloeophyllum trabeum ATCC 11539]EPQ59772.1 general substrate transporter [Gloeophyllum trabeum ATCC 11539]